MSRSIAQGAAAGIAIADNAGRGLTGKHEAARSSRGPP
jgi:hypothetical protein